MSVGGISSIGSGYPLSATNSQTNRTQGKQDFQALADALNSNDLSGAQSAFAALQTDFPGLANLLQSAQTSNSNNPLATDFQSLSTALSKNDLTGAKAAFAKLQQDTQALQVGHHHHHHHGGGGSALLAAAPVIGASSDNTSSTSQSSVNVLG